jgi:hypothetical protein
VDHFIFTILNIIDVQQFYAGNRGVMGGVLVWVGVGGSKGLILDVFTPQFNCVISGYTVIH